MFRTNYFSQKFSANADFLHYLDVEDVKFVINFDYPSNSEDYIHRIGRTGRSNNTGTAYTLFTPQNAPKANDLCSVLREANQVINPRLLELANSSYGRKFNRGRGMGNREQDRARFNRAQNSSGGGRMGGGMGGNNRDRSRSRQGNGHTNGRTSRFSNERSGGGAGGASRENGRASRFDKPASNNWNQPSSESSGARTSRFSDANSGYGRNGNSNGSSYGSRSNGVNGSSNNYSQPPPLMSLGR